MVELSLVKVLLGESISGIGVLFVLQELGACRVICRPVGDGEEGGVDLSSEPGPKPKKLGKPNI